MTPVSAWTHLDRLGCAAESWCVTGKAILQAILPLSELKAVARSLDVIAQELAPGKPMEPAPDEQIMDAAMKCVDRLRGRVENVGIGTLAELTCDEVRRQGGFVTPDVALWCIAELVSRGRLKCSPVFSVDDVVNVP